MHKLNSLKLLFLQIFALLLVYIGLRSEIEATTYLITPYHEKVFSKCESFPDHFITNVLDLTNLSFIYQEDDSLQVSGTITCIAEFSPTAKVNFDLDVFKKQRGEWTNTIFNFHRDDMCAALYRPGELWYPWTRKIPEHKRECPPPNGMVYLYDDKADAKINLPDHNLSGEYKLQITVTFGDGPDDFICINIIIQIDKV